MDSKENGCVKDTFHCSVRPMKESVKDSEPRSVEEGGPTWLPFREGSVFYLGSFMVLSTGE